MRDARYLTTARERLAHALLLLLHIYFIRIAEKHNSLTTIKSKNMEGRENEK